MTTRQDNSIIEKIQRLKKQRNAVILVHNYQRAEVQDIGDFVGDSLELSRKAAETQADVIVFCGVHFMAETASILNPQRKVLLPDPDSGCPMADMISAGQLRERKAAMPGVTVVTYVNSTAAVKAESDYCCTSANGVKVVENIKSDNILFVPDQYLGDFISRRTGKKMALWPGYCPTHMKVLPEDILQRKKEHPGVKVVVHPECRPDTIALADEALSTSGMARYAARPDIKELIIGTEIEILHRLHKENPGKKFYPVSNKVVCPNMKKITLEKILKSLETLTPEVKVPEDIRVKALVPVNRMLAMV
jgi:quinolinate synthase